MSELPNVGGQSCWGPGGAVVSPAWSACRHASMAGQSAALRVSFQTAAPYVRVADRVDVVAEELVGQRVRARAARVAGRAAVELGERAGRRRRVADESACSTTPDQVRGSVVFVRNGVVNAL